MPGRLQGKAAIVTGGTSGIGRRTAEVFVEEGASVLIAARREHEGRRLASSLGEQAHFLRTDVSSEADVKRMIAYAVDRFGKLDCLVNNAGSPASTGGIAAVAFDAFQEGFSVLVGGTLLGMKHAAPVMRAQGSGSIINMGSVAGVRAGYSSSLIYSAAKAAVIHLTTVVAMELGESNVRVNCISPGAIATGIFGKAAGLPTEQAEKTAEVMKQVLTNVQPIRRAGLAEDIARVAAFLASDESGFINGHNLVVDGGLTGGRLWSVQQDSLARVNQVLLRAAGS